MVADGVENVIRVEQMNFCVFKVQKLYFKTKIGWKKQQTKKGEKQSPGKQDGNI